MPKPPLDINYPPTRVVDGVRAFVRLSSRLIWRIRYIDTQHVPPPTDGPLIVAANHQTYFDPFWICAPFRRRFRFMAWDKAFDWFFVGWLIRYLGAFPVDTKRGTTKNVLRECLAAIRDGATLIIFPEGARSFPDGRMVRFRAGAVRVALETGTPILPVTVCGGNRVWSQTMKYPAAARVRIIYHPPIVIPPVPEGVDRAVHIETWTEKLRAVIGSKLDTDDSP